MSFSVYLGHDLTYNYGMAVKNSRVATEYGSGRGRSSLWGRCLMKCVSSWGFRTHPATMRKPRRLVFRTRTFLLWSVCTGVVWGKCRELGYVMIEEGLYVLSIGGRGKEGEGEKANRAWDGTERLLAPTILMVCKTGTEWERQYVNKERETFSPASEQNMNVWYFLHLFTFPNDLLVVLLLGSYIIHTHIHTYISILSTSSSCRPRRRFSNCSGYGRRDRFYIMIHYYYWYSIQPYHFWWLLRVTLCCSLFKTDYYLVKHLMPTTVPSH